MIEASFVPGGGGEVILLPALGIETRVLVPAAAGAGVALFEETTAAGRGPPLHVHHRQTEIFRFLEGSYEIVVGDRRFPAEAGATAVVPPGTPHAFRNVGAGPARLLFALTPADGAEGFFRSLAALTADGMPAPAALAELAARFGTEFTGPPLGG